MPGVVYSSDKKILCWHGETKASGSIKQDKKDGKWRYHCFGCHFHGDEMDVRIMRTGQSFKELTMQAPPPPGRPAAKAPAKQAEEPTLYTGDQIKARLDRIGTDRTRHAYRRVTSGLSFTSHRTMDPGSTWWRFGSGLRIANCFASRSTRLRCSGSHSRLG